MTLPDTLIYQRFAFCPSCGAASESIPQAPVFNCSSCGIEMHFSPVTSAAALIADSQGRLLMVRRKKDPRKGTLGVPGGFVSPGESLDTALQREVREEVNLELESWRYLGGWPNLYTYKNVTYATTDIYFEAQARDIDTLQLCAEEVAGVVFAEPISIDREQLAFRSLEQAIDAYLALRGS